MICFLPGKLLNAAIYWKAIENIISISTVIIPKLNEKDLVDVPEEAKQKLKFIPVENVDEALSVALEKDSAQPTPESKVA